MAQRFQKALKGRTFSTGAWLLFLLPLPLIPAAIFSLISGNLLHLSVSLGAYAAYLYSALLTRQALKAEARYAQRKFARRPSLLGKRTAGIITSLSTAALAYLGADQSLILSIVYGLLCALGFDFAYGFGTLHTPIVKNHFKADDPEIADILEQAEAKIVAIEYAADELNSVELIDRLKRITTKAREILYFVANDPRELRRARKFMHVYLDGAQRVSQGYARTHRQIRSGELDENFRRVLITIEKVFIEQQSKLLEHDVQDLDVQIEVLKTQLENEGVI
ncbi:MAG: 5-bromo-4-chloroindolyl phosphate hydrolysis family protein [Pseudomonadota bacterium]